MRQLTLFDTRNFEYFFLISPAKSVSYDVMKIKQKINEVVPISSKDLHSVPHISLFKMKYTNSDDLILSRLKQTLTYTKKFQIVLNGMSFFDNNHTKTAYVSIANPEPIISLQRKLLDTFQRQVNAFIPHLTIARSIANIDIATVEMLVSNYNANFCCSKITLLKKAIGDQSEQLKYTKIYEALLN